MSDEKNVIILTGSGEATTPISEIMDAVESMREEEPMVFEITMPMILPERIKDLPHPNKNRRRGNKHINHYNK